MIIFKGLQPTLEARPGDQERIILHLDLDAFFAQVEEVACPSLRGKPVFIVGHSLTRGVVLTSNYEARKYGVKTGMALHEAKKLCPVAVLVPADCSKYADTSERIFARLVSYSPQVEPFSIDEAFLDITDTFRFWGTPEAVARDIKAWVWDNFNLTLSIGIAPNKLLSKLASERLKPDGLFRIKPSEVESLLRDLPADKLCGIGSRLKLRLERLGIRTAGDLGKASEGLLMHCFGIMGSVLKRMGQGIDHSPVRASDHAEEAKSIGHSYTLTEATAEPETLFRYLLWLAEKTARRLRRQGLEGRIIHATLRLSDFETLSRQEQLSFYTQDGKTLFEYGRRLFLSLHTPGRSVRLVGISVSGLRPGGRQGHLFEDPERRRRLLQTLDRINDRYGEFTLRPAFLSFPDDEKIASRALQLFGSGRH